jgi:DegV family protein with EDD domain
MQTTPESSGPGRVQRHPGWLDRLRSRGREAAAREAAAAGGPRIAIVTDTAAALPASWVAGHGSSLTVVSMPVMIDGQIYTEGLDDVETALAMALATGRSVQTSRPAPGLFQRTYRQLAEQGFDEIVSVHLSGKLSGTVEAARWAAGETEIPVSVVDTATVGLAQGFAVMDTVTAATCGATSAEAAGVAEGAGRNSISFAVPSLEQLRKGGRIGTAASMLGTILSVKPILGVDDGQIVVREKVRTQARALGRLVALARETAEQCPNGARLAVHFFGNAEQARELTHELAGASAETVLCEPLPAVLAAHSGAGVLAIVVAPLPPLPEQH